MLLRVSYFKIDARIKNTGSMLSNTRITATLYNLKWSLNAAVLIVVKEI